ncbi:MAG: hypothetical protein ACRD96_27730, partial [Bryobacteraceae bacterium]
MRSALLLAFALAVPSPAQKKPVTIEAAAATQRPAGAVVWAPDGKRFAYRERNSIWLYDVPSKLRRELVSLPKLEEKAVKGARPETFDWRNRRVVERTFSWSASGKEMLVVASGDLFGVRLDDGAITQL